MKSKSCELCGENSGRRKICLIHKVEYPYKASPSGANPFNRFNLMYLPSKKEKKVRKEKMLSPEEITKFMGGKA